MIEAIKAFFSSVWEWFVINKDSITAFFMSGQFVSFIVALVTLFRTLKQTSANTKSTDALNETLGNTNKMSTAVDNLDVNFQALKRENDSLRNELKETEEALQVANSEIKNKLNAIIEVQAIVYSTIRDDSVRQTVNAILNNARYSEKNFKEELESKIEDFKQAYNEELKAMNDRVTESMNAVKDTLNAAENAKNQMRKNMDVNRY